MDLLPRVAVGAVIPTFCVEGFSTFLSYLAHVFFIR